MKIWKTLLPLLLTLLAHTAFSAPRDESIQADLLMTRITGLIQANKQTEALPYFEQLEALNMALPESFYYHYIDALDMAGKAEKVFERCEHYMGKYGKRGKYYAQVLPIYARAEDAHRAAVAKAEAIARAKEEAKKQAEAAAPFLKKLSDEMVLIPSTEGIPSFYMGQTEVTQGLWEAVMGDNPSLFGYCGSDCPVDNVSWNDIQQFIKKLNAKTGKTYRLPTVWEWVYACSAGRRTKYCGSDNLDTVGWYKVNSGGGTHPVRSKQANAFGLYDMSGNVWELMDDCAEGNCGKHVMCGGSWDYEASFMEARAIGVNRDSSFSGGYIGFRLARSAP